MGIHGLVLRTPIPWSWPIIVDSLRNDKLKRRRMKEIISAHLHWNVLLECKSTVRDCQWTRGVEELGFPGGRKRPFGRFPGGLASLNNYEQASVTVRVSFSYLLACLLTPSHAKDDDLVGVGGRKEGRNGWRIVLEIAEKETKLVGLSHFIWDFSPSSHLVCWFC